MLVDKLDKLEGLETEQLVSVDELELLEPELELLDIVKPYGNAPALNLQAPRNLS